MCERDGLDVIPRATLNFALCYGNMVKVNYFSEIVVKPNYNKKKRIFSVI